MNAVLAHRRRLMEMGGSLLPRGYTQLEYIVNPSTAYINTNIALADTDSLRIVFTASNTSFFITGRNGSSATARMFVLYNRQQWNTRPSSSFNIADAQKHDLLMSNGSITIGNVGKTFTGGTIQDTGSIVICAAWDNTGIALDSRRMEGKIYLVEIKDTNGDYRFNGIPAKDSGGSVGLYDIVTQAFFTSPDAVQFTEN